MVFIRLLKSKLSQFMMKTNRLVVIRHGESEFNLENKFCGWHDVSLSPNGASEACDIAADALIKAKMQFDVCYTSVLRRSRDTADIILAKMNSSYVPIKADWRLCERHYGNLTGYNKRFIADRYGEEQVQYWRRGYDGLPPPIQPDNRYYYAICNNPVFSDVPAGQFPLTESLHMCVERVKPAWDDILDEVLKGNRVMICIHGTVARALIKHIEGLSDEDIQHVNIPNSVPRVYEYDLKTGKLIGGGIYLGDPEYIKKMTAQVASIGK
ncbi:phosphoglycerate mutase 2 isoform X1 [Drosophila willistoni]|uniref:phosphoglycerate mutase 2 isoform X1 n=1 Tax=Drosophila willistoni TaxID=7260 RepID=UPI00017D9543|nr:phosphoglycerate mutase 2 isoform X1 [Drosophila willistoni]